MTTTILNYKDLTTEIQHMWNINAKVILVIRGATGTISKSFRQYLSNKPGRNDILQKTVISGTACVFQKVLM
jgi:hypothetical protein